MKPNTTIPLLVAALLGPPVVQSDPRPVSLGPSTPTLDLRLPVRTADPVGYELIQPGQPGVRDFGDTYDIGVMWFCQSGSDYLTDTGSGPGPCLSRTYDAVAESCGTNVFSGAGVQILESETDNGDGTVTVIVQAGSVDGSDMLPPGFTCAGRGGNTIDTAGCDLAKQDAGGPGIPGDPLDPFSGVGDFLILDADAVIFGAGGTELLSFNLNSEGTTRSELKDRFTVSGVDQVTLTAMQFRYVIAVGPPAGACCLPTTPVESCQILTNADCFAQGGVYFGDYSACAGIPCGPPPNDDCDANSTADDGITPFDTTDATLDPSVPPPCDADMTSDMWYRYTATCTGDVTIQTCSGPDTVLQVYNGQTCPPGTTAGCSDNAPGCGTGGLGSFLELPATFGQPFTIRVGGNGAISGVLDITCVGTPPAGGACCTGPTGCVQVANAAQCAGTYLGDGTTCGVFYNVEALSTTTHFNTCDSDYNTVLEIYDVCGGSLLANNDDCANTAGGGGADLNGFCYDPAPASGERDSCTCLASTVGQDFFVKVTSFGGGPPPPGSSTFLFVQHGGACNTHPSGACCIDGNCAGDTRQGYCEGAGGAYQGDGTSCAETICPEPTGACCYSNGSCLDPVHRSDCITGGNDWHGNQTCAQVSCAQPPRDYVRTAHDGAPDQNFIDLDLPAGVLAPGSAPIMARAQLIGVPLASGTSGNASVQTLRDQDPVAPADPSSTVGSASFELRSLKTISAQPVPVTIDGNLTLWSLQVELSATASPPAGTITATKTHANGGTANITFAIQPLYTFTRVGSCMRGDGNEDGVIDQADVPGFVDSLLGPDAPAGAAAECFDHDNDGDVDLADYMLRQKDGMNVQVLPRTVVYDTGVVGGPPLTLSATGVPFVHTLWPGLGGLVSSTDSQFVLTVEETAPGNPASQIANVYVLVGDAIQQTVSIADLCFCDLELGTEDHEGTEVGKVIVKNEDDDDNDLSYDRFQAPVPGETNLRRLLITWDPVSQCPPIYLHKGDNGTKIKVWLDPEKNSEITFNGVDNRFTSSPKEVWVEGQFQSDKVDDVELFANFDNSNSRACTERLTVLWVDTWTFRKTNAEEWHADFVPDFDPRTDAVDPLDNRTGLHIYHDRIGQGLEVRGRVKPSDFTFKIVVEREKNLKEFRDTTDGSTLRRSTSFSTENFLTLLRASPVPTSEGDTCETCNDQDPQSHGSAGHIYDWDNSGISNQFAAGNIDRARKNFIQWPRYGGERCGDLAFWSQAMSVTAAGAPPQLTLGGLPLEGTFNARGDNLDLRTSLSIDAFQPSLDWDLQDGPP